MAYLIDGSNFLGHISPYQIRSSRSKLIFVSQLLVFKRQRRTKIFLVFDGPAEPSIMEITSKIKSFRVITPPAGENADILIKEIISQQKDLKKFFVVSSDREIKNFARNRGAFTLTCKEFDIRLKKTLKQYQNAQYKKKKEIHLSPLEVNHWLNIFKRKK